MKARGQICAPLRLPGLGLRWRESDIAAWIDDCARNQPGVTRG